MPQGRLEFHELGGGWGRRGAKPRVPLAESQEPPHRDRTPKPARMCAYVPSASGFSSTSPSNFARDR
jgi:hypothetical protein